MGRKKIKIERITDERNRQVTFNKRKNGLLKKAMELSLLCDSSVALIIMNNSASAKERVFEYCSSELDKHLVRYVEISEPGVIKYANNDYYKLFGKKGSIGSDGDDCSPDEGVNQPLPPPSLPSAVIHSHGSPPLSAGSQLHPQDPLPRESSLPGPNNSSHHYNGYPMAAVPPPSSSSHKEHNYPIHGQSFEDFLRQSNYPIFDGSSSYYDTPCSSASSSHDHPSSHPHGTLFCPPIQLSKDLLPPHPHLHPHHPPPFPFSLGVHMHAHAFPSQDPSYSAPPPPHRDRDVTSLFSHPSHNHIHSNNNNSNNSSNHQTQPSQSSSPTPSLSPQPPHHSRGNRESLSMSSDSFSKSPSTPEIKKRKIEISA